MEKTRPPLHARNACADVCAMFQCFPNSVLAEQFKLFIFLFFGQIVHFKIYKHQIWQMLPRILFQKSPLATSKVQNRHHFRVSK